MRLPSTKFLRGPSLRKAVFERDRGVCALCGLDTEALEAAILRIRCEEKDRGYWRTFVLRRAGIRPTRTLWHADHIQAVSEGGGECDIQNFRTLCQTCHRKATAELRKRLSKATRKEEKLGFSRRIRLADAERIRLADAERIRLADAERMRERHTE